MAAPSALRQRKRADLDRAEAAANAIAGENEEVAEKAHALKDVSGRDSMHEETNRITALADLLEAIAVAVGVTMPEDPSDGTELEDVDGVNAELAGELRAAGYETPEDLGDASDEELLRIDGIGPATLKKIRADL